LLLCHLLEKERYAAHFALIPQWPRPIRIHRSGIRTTISALPQNGQCGHGNSFSVGSVILFVLLLLKFRLFVARRTLFSFKQPYYPLTKSQRIACNRTQNNSKTHVERRCAGVVSTALFYYCEKIALQSLYSTVRGYKCYISNFLHVKSLGRIISTQFTSFWPRW